MSNWKSFLDNHRSQVQGWLDSLKTSGNERENKSAWMHLQNRKLLLVKGPEAEKFLQGQLTCDLKDAEDNRILSGAHCNPKGRMLSNFDLIKMNSETYALRLHASIAESALHALKKYIVFSKAEISVSEHYQLVGFYANSQEISKFAIRQPEPGQFAEHAGHFLLRHSEQQWELWAPSDQQAFEPVTEAMTHLREDQWTLLNIRAGKAELNAETVEQFLPQELNLHLIGAVSFKKGCYTGQEIVARLHYKGSLKKHLYRARIHTATAPCHLQALEEQQAPDKTSTKKVGTLASFATCAENGYELLVVCNDEASTSKNVTLATNKLQWAPLPYAIPG